MPHPITHKCRRRHSGCTVSSVVEHARRIAVHAATDFHIPRVHISKKHCSGISGTLAWAHQEKGCCASAEAYTCAAFSTRQPPPIAYGEHRHQSLHPP